MKFILSCFIFLSSISCAPASYNNPGIKNITVQEAIQIRTEKDLIVLDVRTPEEYQSGHLQDAKNVNFLAGDFDTQIKSLDKSKKYVVYCKKGGRSRKASEVLVQAGFENVLDVSGGFDAWKAQNLPIKK